MKTLIITSILAVLVATATAAVPQRGADEYLGLPGDNLNLYAVMKLFQESETLEGFERTLNDENSRINNLDLNGDNLVDYLTVNDYVDGNVHNIVLRAALGKNEYQDVAVFTVQRFSDGSVQIQLTGDEALYGRNYIIEPIYGDSYAETPNPGYTGRVNNSTVVRTTVYAVADWPVIRFIYFPGYSVWRSSWYWGYYPVYWHPWRPFYWHFYFGYHYNWHNHYYSHYRLWHHQRYAHYNDFYYRKIRSYSPHVYNRINEGKYRYTYAHPEQRREGEALYARTYRRENTNTMLSGNNNRRSSSGSVRPIANSHNGASEARRGGNVNENRTVGNSSYNPNSGNSRRSVSVSTNRPAGNTSAVHNSDNFRRSSNTAGNREATAPSRQVYVDASARTQAATGNRSYSNLSTSRETGTVRRPANTATGRTYTRPSSPQYSSGSGRSAAPVVNSRPAIKATPSHDQVTSRRTQPSAKMSAPSRSSAPVRNQSSGSYRQSSGGSSSPAHRSAQVNRSSGGSKGGSSRESENNSSSRRR